jgi:6-phosphogluconate dehydrogenase
MQIGFIGLGKMGTRMVEKLLLEGHVVIGWNRTRETTELFHKTLSDRGLDASFIASDDIESLVKGLTTPRIIWVMLPAGDATKMTLLEIAKYVQEGDIVIDGGNSYYKDTEKHAADFHAKGVRFLGIGVSGGVQAGKNGYPLMIGGEVSAYEHIRPLLDSLAKPGGAYAYFGTGGAGHFVKMVHNGIEYGMMQAIGEGFGVIEKAPYQFDLLEVAKLWQRGTIIASFLMNCSKYALEKDPRLTAIEGKIAATGEAEWTVSQAKEEGVPIENIEQSLLFRQKSQTDASISNSFAAKMVAALRHEFGGHAVEKK